jgi:antitoxin component of MazEF toxin-antitoxin module
MSRRISSFFWKNFSGGHLSGKAVAQGRAIGYLSAVQTKIEKMGDAFGLLLPKELLDACGFGREATVTVQNKTLIVTPGPGGVRQGWAEAARRMRERGDDLTPELQEWQSVRDEWDDKEWTWPGLDSNEKV